MQAIELVNAFNTACPRKTWKARHYKKGTQNFAHFENRTGLVHFTYVEETGEFLVIFQKASAAFQDFANAICKGMVTILSALQAGGLPFSAPDTPEGVKITIKHGGIGSPCSVRWDGMFKHPLPYQLDEDGVELGGEITGEEENEDENNLI